MLGPLLFLIYINDLPEEVKSNALLFADDTKIYRLTKSVADSAALQQDLNSLVDWSRRWLLAFNASKCHVLSLGKIENIDHAFYYAMDGTELEHVFEEKDLGVFTSSSLLWNDNIKYSVRKANGKICWIARNLILRDIKTMKAVYKALIRPHLEYCVQLWNPVAEHGNWNLILELEGVQRRFNNNNK